MNEDECILEIEKKGKLDEEKKAVVKLAFAYGVMEGINFEMNEAEK
jgi:hypothetical protein